ncbi:MAG: hypothetical protein OHK0046_13450 [Anaerolineae bacterium]
MSINQSPGTPPAYEKSLKEQGIDVKPVSQGTESRAKWIPVWVRHLPKINFPTQPNPDFKLINEKVLNTLETEGVNADYINRLQSDMNDLEQELMRYFRELDHKAKRQQNGYRRYQIAVLMLATFATMIGSVQAIALSSNPAALPIWGAAEALVALFTVFVVQTRGPNTSLPEWLSNRRKTEQLRREYFRYLMYLPPYKRDEPAYERRQKLANRVADVYNEKFPEEPSILETGGID